LEGGDKKGNHREGGKGKRAPSTGGKLGRGGEGRNGPRGGEFFVKAGLKQKRRLESGQTIRLKGLKKKGSVQEGNSYQGEISSRLKERRTEESFLRRGEEGHPPPTLPREVAGKRSGQKKPCEGGKPNF